MSSAELVGLDEGIRDVLMRAAALDRKRQYTLRLDFTAGDPSKARALAVTLATALGMLRPDVETYSARLSAGGRWTDAGPAFCLADGPYGAFCAYPHGHHGWHAEDGVDGQRWGDGDGRGVNRQDDRDHL